MPDPDFSLTAATELLGRLVACPSVNPRGAVPAGPPFGEAAMAELLRALLTGWGAQVTVTEIAPGRPNLTARFAGRDPARSLMLEAHSDTVAVDGMVIPPFAPVVRDGRLYGRGACDTKGPMAAMLLGLRQVLDADGQPPVTVWFVSTCNEELGGTGARALIDGGFRADAALVAEPTELSIVHAHKGALRVALETAGVAVHSANPDRGVNAIYQMVPVLERLQREAIPALRQVRHPLLGSPTLSVGTIHGGTQVNVVPARCRIELDRRLVPGEDREAVLRQLCGADPVRAEVSEYYPVLEESRTSRIAQCTAAACQAVLGQAILTTAPYATNAGFFKAAGIPTVVFGPGSIAQAHTKDEFIELDQVSRAAAVYATIIRAWGNR